MNILADATLPGLKQAFPEPFHVTLYQHPDDISRLLTGQDVLLCRSTLKVNASLLKNHSLGYVASASSGIDHLDAAWLSSQNIKIIDAKGCNARSVADYVVSCLAYLKHHHLISGNKAGVIGLGKVGEQVSKRIKTAGFQVLHFDPPKEQQEPFEFQSCALEDLYQVDLLCIHAALHDTHPFPSTNLINQQFLKQLKPNCIIINAARGGIVDEEALLKVQKKLIYCTDVYANEPMIDERIIEKATLATPHIAGHSLEAKYLAVSMISETLHQILHLPFPHFATPEKSSKPHLDQNNKAWEENILSIYNPLTETLQLKKAINKERSFLKVRKNHQQRHDFLFYTNQDLDLKTRVLLGE